MIRSPRAADSPTPPDAGGYALTDRYDATDGVVVLTGLQAITRALVDRVRLDARRGLHTGGVASGYPGSPLGGLDLTLHRAEAVLRAHAVQHVPGVNEELAAAVISGTQQPHVGGLRAGIDGVFGMWYGKSPGADRCGDVFKHANFLGAHPRGGMLAVVGDDPAAKSSSLPSHSETIFADAHMPVLVPGTTQELLDYAITAIELSRYSGCWVGMTVLTSVADSVGSVLVDPERLRLDHPEVVIDGVPWRHEQRIDLTATVLIDRERDLLEGRHLAAEAFAAANGLNRIEGATGDAWIGFAAAGKTYLDLRQALATLGFDDARLRHHGIRLLKLGMTFPLESTVVHEFARGLDEIVVVEEKRAFIENAVRNVLYGGAHQPRVVGKHDATGERLVPVHGELTADRLVPVLVRELGRRLDVHDPRPPAPRSSIPVAAVSRAAAYCSGCPHNRSTVVPEGAVVGAGVGCHGMSYFDPRLVSNPKLAVVPMGSEGVPWIGLAGFSDTTHIFQQLGDGTFTHSGQLAVRACVSAGVNVTFKILYNGYVAMTGGQDIAGGMTVGAMSRMLHAEGVQRTIVCTEDLDRYHDRSDLAPGTDVWHRDRVLEAQEELRRVPGVTVLLYDQVCAAEARRLRRTGELELPPRQVVINELVCEGCGDCSTQSNCLSVQPVDTELGRKTQIHQSSCNRDYSCLNGDCPSFVSFTPRRTPVARTAASAVSTPATAAPAEPAHKVELGAGPYGIYLVGIGGTGVVTVNQVLATAARLDGIYSAGMDQTGMSQKAGQVSSHLQLSRTPLDARTAAVAEGEADAYLVFDILSGAADQHLVRAGGARTTAIVSTSAVPTASIVTSLATSFPDVDTLTARIAERTRADRLRHVDAIALAESSFGDHVLANVLLLGVAYQEGVLPLSATAIERAIELNGVAVDRNLAAFRLGRRVAVDPNAVVVTAEGRPERRLGAQDLEASRGARRAAARLVDAAAFPAELRAVCEPRAADLVDYQDGALAARYIDAIASVERRERDLGGDGSVAGAAARGLHKLLAYKDEYEVARLHLKVDVGARAREELGVPVDVRYHLHPPVLRSLGMSRKIEVGPWIRPAFRGLRAMRRVRGTALDPFGRAHLRRVERALAGEYLTALDAAFARRGDALDAAQRVADAADLVRGYEHIKLANVETFRAAIAAAAPGTAG